MKIVKGQVVGMAIKSKPKKAKKPAKPKPEKKIEVPQPPPMVIIPPKGNRRGCFVCNGVGEMCDICGDSVDVCRCDDDGRGTHKCDSCGGVGVAILDQTEQEKADNKQYRRDDEEDED